MGLPLQAQVEKTVHGVEIHLLFSQEKVLGVAVNKEVLTVFLDMKGPITIDFLSSLSREKKVFFKNI